MPEDASQGDAPSEKASLQEWFVFWSAGRSVTESRHRADHLRWHRYVPDALRETPLADVSRGSVKDLLVGLMEKGVGPYTVDAVLGEVRALVRLAAKEGRHVEDVTAGLAVDDAVPLNTVRPEATLSRVQTRLIEDAITPVYGIWVHLASVVGLSRGEIIALTTDSVDLRQAQISVTRAYTEQRGKFHLREVEPRVVPIEPETVQALMYHLTFVMPTAPLSVPTPPPLVFNARGKPPFSQNLTTHHLQPAVVKAGITARVTAQVLRHSAVRYQIERGASLEDISQRMGYASLATVRSLYSLLWDAFAPEVESLRPSVSSKERKH